MLGIDRPTTLIASRILECSKPISTISEITLSEDLLLESIALLENICPECEIRYKNKKNPSFDLGEKFEISQWVFNSTSV
jgi:hypothetical protein